MKRFWMSAQAKLRQAERGEASAFEFTLMIAPMLALILFIAVITIYWGTRIPARRAATDCVRAAIATLDAPTGIAQGTIVAQESLKGNNMRADSFHIDIYGDWSPGGRVTCSVRYRIKVPDESMRGGGAGYVEQIITVFSPAALVINETISLDVEPFKSDWKN